MKIQNLNQKKASLYTLGCRLNQYETQTICNTLQNAGYKIVPFGDSADLGIINTCTVTREADAKCRQIIRKFIRSNPNAITAVIGCYSQIGYKAIASIQGVDLIIGNHDKLNILNYIGSKKNKIPVIIRDRINKDNFTISFTGELPFSKRANLKIQDGCDFMCSFCIITRSRGRARSRKFDNIIAEAKKQATNGVREIILTGVNIGTYNDDNHDIVEVVDALNILKNENSLQRIRISSIEPTTIPLALLQRMSDKNHALVPYLHIPMQAGSEKILTGMRRKYKLSDFLKFINFAKKTVPNLCIGTDIMVGFPGERDEEFNQTCKVFINHPFTYAHVFSYSERHSVPSTRMPNIIPVVERYRRSNELRRLSAKKRFDTYTSMIGKEMTVLVENQREGLWPGYTENYIRTFIQSNQNLTNRLCMVRLEEAFAEHMEARLIKILN